MTRLELSELVAYANLTRTFIELIEDDGEDELAVKSCLETNTKEGLAPCRS